MFLDGTLNTHLKDIQEQATLRVEQIIKQLKDNSDSVSYTHLDVYKRQVLFCCSILFRTVLGPFLLVRERTFLCFLMHYNELILISMHALLGPLNEFATKLFVNRTPSRAILSKLGVSI